MKTRDALRMTGIAAAVLASFGGAYAQSVEPPAGSALNVEASSVSLGVGLTLNDGARFGEYNGMTREGAYGLIDFNLVRRDDETGTWTQFFGRDVALDNRQLRFDQSRQGDWGYSVDYARIPRYEPYTITTGVAGIGTPNLTVPSPASATGMAQLSTVRERLDLGFEKFISGNWDVQLSFRNEQKNGARVFGRGDGASFEFTPEPIDSVTRLIEAKLNYTTSALQLSGGYYGSFYNNQSNGLNIAGGNAQFNNPASPFTPIALPPDNQAHQLYLSGGYNFAQTTRGNFKLAYTKATQTDAFISPVTPPQNTGTPDNLMGRVDTTLAQAGIVSSPMPKLTLRADLRYENRDDKTPVYVYQTTPSSTSDGTNDPRSIRTTTAKAEASYALPDGFRLTGGLGWEQKWRNVQPVRIVSARDTTDEISYRLELRRMMSESLTGALMVVHSDRTGSPWLTTVTNTGAPGSNLIAPTFNADRTRDKVRFTANWNPTEPLTLTFYIEAAKDDYSHRPGSDIGPESGSATNFSIDAAYALGDRWQLTGWYTKYDTKAEQTTCVNALTPSGCNVANPTSPVWRATIQNLSNNFGLGMRGKPIEGVQVGADLSYSDIRDQFQQTALTGNPIQSLPDITTKLTRLNVFGRYALDKNSGVRLDYIYDRYQTDDWTWSTWVYTDGTTLSQNPNQKVNFLAASYYFKF